MSYQRKIGAGVLAVLLTFVSVINVNAATYPDVQKHWAKDYIEKISENKLISGYEDGKFRPDNEVSRLEAIIMTCNLFNPDLIDKTYVANGNKWQSKLKQNNIPTWSWKYVVFALENQIIPSSDEMLSSLMSKTDKDVQIRALKYEAVVFLVNALGWTDERSTAVALKYKDTEDINPQARPYIDVLIRKGVIGDKGDNNGNFGAKKGVTRGEMALMLANSYRYAPRVTGNQPIAAANTTTDIANLPKNPVEVSTTTGVSASKTDDFVVVDGSVLLLSQSGNDVSLFITDNSGQSAVYTNRAENIQVQRVNTPIGLMEIKSGDRVRLLTTADKKVTSIILNENNVVRGLFSGTTTTVDIQVKTADRIINYPMAQQAIITLDGQPAKLTDFRVDDKVDVYLVNGKVNEVKATSGVGTTMRYTPADNRALRLKNAVIKELRLTTTGNRVIVEDADGRTYDLEVTYQTAIRYKNSKDDINALRVGYLVDVYATGNRADELLTYGEYKASKIDGVVANIDDRNNFMEIEVSRGRMVKVYYNSKTQIEDARGSLLNPTRIYRGDKVTVTGYEGIGGLDAGRIIVDIVY